MNNNDDWERFKNFTLFKFYGTDKEFEEAAPVLGIIAVVFIVIVIIFCLFRPPPPPSVGDGPPALDKNEAPAYNK